VNWRQIYWPSNLLSLTRIVLALPLGYCLTMRTTEGVLGSVAILTLAGLTDFFDGYVARHSGRVSSLGAALDPIADKVFAAILILFLIAYRNFPIWLAVAMVGRDLVLLVGGFLLIRHNRPTIPARLYGKYLFYATIMLLGSYVIEYRFGEIFSTAFVLGLCAASLIDYAVVFSHVDRGEPLPPYDESAKWRTTRVVVTALATVVYIVVWIFEIAR